MVHRLEGGGGVPQKKLLDMILWEDVERYLMDDLTLENNYGVT